MDSIKFDAIEGLVFALRDQQILVDTDVAMLYGVETKRINEAVKNNPDRFPDGYIFHLTSEEKKELVENFDRFEKLKHSSVNPKAFTEKGLYMLATILKSQKAVETTLSIIETFAKIRMLARTIKELSTTPEKSVQKALMEKSGRLIADVLDEDLVTDNSETTIELNFAVLKFKHTVTKKKSE